MTDKQFENHLIKLSKAHAVYIKLLKIGEKEYKRRFGNYPGAVHDDFWIDTFIGNGGYASLDQVTDAAKECIGIYNDDFLKIKIADLLDKNIMSVRLYNSLETFGIEFISEVLKYSDEELLNGRNFGVICLNELKGILKQFNIFKSK